MVSTVATTPGRDAPTPVPARAAASDRLDAGVALATAAGFLVLYGLTLFPTPAPVGDGADYTTILREGVLPERMAPHVGYYLLVRPVMMLGTLAGLPATLVAHGVAAVAMAAAVGIAHLIFRRLGLRRAVSLTATLALGGSGLIWYNAVQGEVTAVCVLLLVASLLLLLTDRPLLSGAAFGFALLVTQLSAPWAVVFPAVALWRRDWRSFLAATFGGTVIFVLGVLPVWQEYLYGVRGVFNVAERLEPVSLPKFVLYSGYRLMESFTLLVPFILLGLVAAARRQRFILVLTGLLGLASSAISIRSLHVEYGVTWIPIFLPLAALAALGLHEVADRVEIPAARRGIPIVTVLLATFLTGWLYVLPKRDDAAQFARDAAALDRIVGESRVVATPEEGMAYAALTRPEAEDVWSSVWVLAPVSNAEWERILATYRPIYAFEIDPEPHYLRRWLFNNPLAVRFLDAEQREGFTSEQVGGVLDMLTDRAVERREVVDTGLMRAWELRPTGAGSPGGENALPQR